MTNFDYIDTNLKADNLIRRLSADSPSLYPFDIETTGLDPHSSTILLIQFQIPYTQEIYVINCITVDYDRLERIVETLWRGGKGQLLGHNLKFDLSFLNVHFPKVYFDNVRDTFIIEQLITNGIIFKPPNLAELALKYLNIELDKSERSSFVHWTGGEFTKEQLEYSARDVEVLRPIYMEQRNHISNLGLDLIMDIECRAVPAFAKMETDGIFVSKQKWDKNIHIAKEQRFQILTKLNDYAVKVFPPKIDLFADTISAINWNSPIQVLELLKQTVNPAIKDTNEKTIANYQHPLIDLLLEYREQEKVITSYGDTVLAQINKKTGRLHPSFNQLGAKTGRVSCIEENQLVPIVGGSKKIKDIKPGDLVFSYTEDNKITIKPVTKVFNNGKQECIKIKWRSTGSWDTGELICTPDHLIKSHNGWKRANELCIKEKLIHYNHEIISIEKYEICNVYDLEVADTHCFIASEILVHNCREPNVQQVPKNTIVDENGVKHSIYREAFVPQVETGYMVGADYSSFELRVLTDLTKEPKWIEGYTDDLDMHSVVASFVFNTKVSKKERPELREIGKAINFGR